MRYLVLSILVLGVMGTVRPASADTDKITPLRLSSPSLPYMQKKVGLIEIREEICKARSKLPAAASKCVSEGSASPNIESLATQVCDEKDPTKLATAVGNLKDSLKGADVDKCLTLMELAGLKTRNESVGNVGGSPAGLESLALEGFLTFILNRSRQEVVSFVSTDLLKRLCTEQKIELVDKNKCTNKITTPINLQELFPATCALNEQAEKAKTVLGVGRLMQNALLEDLRGLPLNMATILPSSDTNQPAKVAACFLRLSDGVFRGLTRRTPPLLLLAAAAEQMTKDPQCSNALKMLSPDLHSRAKLVGRAVVAAVYLVSTLTAAEISDAQAFSEKVLGRLELTEDVDRKIVKKALDALLPPISQLYVLVTRTPSSITAMDSERYKGFLKEVLAATFQILELTVDVSADLASEAGKIPDEQKKVLDGLIKGLHGANQILQADYAGGIGTLLMALTNILDAPKLAGLIKVAALLTDLSSAKTGDEVATALEKSAAPLGGWRQRRQYAMFSLSAQLGLHAKLEHVLADPRPPLGLLFGLSAPVGVDISWPLLKSSSFGLFLQVIDLGTVASGRMAALESGTEPKAEPNLGFLQVFSPGASVFVGLGNSPFVLSGSFAYVPSIRTVTLASGDEPRSALQFGLSIAVDLPILPMFRW